MKNESLPGAIVSRARSAPEHVALVDGDRSLTYGELDAEVIRLANVLAAAGVRRGSRVASFLDRSIDAAIATVAIMLAGAACVPLDPALAPDRLADVLARTGCTLAVGDASAHGLPLVDVHAGDDGAAPSLPPLEAEDVAVVLAVAGPVPAEVAVAHGDLLALLGATKGLFDFAAGDRWALFHSMRSDVAIWELAAALTSGGTAVVVPASVARDGAAIDAFVERERIAILHQTPSSFRGVTAAQAKSGRAWPDLRWLLFTGEPIDRLTLRRFRARRAETAPGELPRLVNMYGTTETTILSTFKLLEDAELAGELASPLGFTLAHQEIVLFGETGAPVADGTAGEMWIRGSGVATGYVGDPPAAGGRFVRRATPDGPARFFRTGDLARRRPNGELEYMGRTAPAASDEGATSSS